MTKHKRRETHIVKSGLPCDLNPDECSSSDAMAIYSDDSKFCFSCNTPSKPNFAKKEEEEEVEDEFEFELEDDSGFNGLPLIKDSESRIRGFRERGITKAVASFYGVRAVQDNAGKITKHIYPVSKDGKVVGQQVRTMPKKFKAHGELEGIFGLERFPSSGRRIIVTEGALDCMAVAQATYDKYGKFYPVVSVMKGAPNAAKCILKERKYFRGFDEVVLMFDQDEYGIKAAKACSKVIGPDKAKIATLPAKDPCDVLKEFGGAALLTAVWDAEQYKPAGIALKEDIWKAIEEYQEKDSIPYPDCLDGLNVKLKGMRDNEIALFTSGTGSGKSTILREIIFHILTTTDEKVGIISLEESIAETGRKLSGMAVNRNPAKDELTTEELSEGFKKVFGDDRVVLLNHDGADLGSDLIDIMEYMALCGCKKVILDHITIAVSEGVDGLTGNEAPDQFMNDLGRLVKRHPLWLGVVSHLRKMGTAGESFEDGKMATLDDIRGSGSIKQVSYDIVAFARNLNAKTETVRNKIKIAVLKSRYSGLTGPAGAASYDYPTGRLKRAHKEGQLSVEDDDLIVELGES
jgi:twinkle protein